MNSFLASALISMAKVEPNLGRRVKFGGLRRLGIRRRVSSSFLVFVMCTRRRRIPSVAKRIHDIPTMKNRDFRFTLYHCSLWSVWTKDAIGEWRVILTLIPIRPFYQTSAGMASVGNGRLRMRRPASLSTLFSGYVHLYLYTKPRARWGSVGDGRLRMRPPAGYDHIRKVTLSQTKTKMSETARAVGRQTDVPAI